jgi:hypothetical protein
MYETLDKIITESIGQNTNSVIGLLSNPKLLIT